MLYFVTGGMRSGKSSYGMRLGLELSESPYYIATARRWDEEFVERIQAHEADRDERWKVLEIEKHLSQEDELSGKVVLVDCLTLWLTNFFVDSKEDVAFCLEKIRQEIISLNDRTDSLIIISNEIGMGVHAHTASGRRFTDLQGWANQFVAQESDRAILMVSGIPMELKS